MSRGLKDAKLFDDIAHHYAKKDMALSSRRARESQLAFAVAPVLRKKGALGVVLDIGCGIAYPARYLDGKYEKYIGVDHSEKMAEAARKFHDGNLKTRFIAASIESDFLPKNTADTIISIGALHHIAELDKAMKNISKIAKPGAILIAVEPQRANPVIQALRRLRSKVDSSYSVDQVFFSEAELRALFKAHGLSNISFRYQGFFVPIFAQVILHPQFIFYPISILAIYLDKFLDIILPLPLKKMSFNIVVTGTFRK